MTPGRLTPLGRQLRFVLVRLRPKASWTPPWEASNSREYRTTSPSVRHQHAYAITPEDEDIGDVPLHGDKVPLPTISARHIRRNPRIDWLAQALNEAGKERLVPARPPGKVDLTYQDVGSNTGRHTYSVNRRRHAQDRAPPLAQALELSLPRIVASFVLHQAAGRNVNERGHAMPFDLAREETEFLSSKGYNLEDIRVWATMLTAEDSELAASLLTQRVSTHGLQAVPLLVFTYILRRERLSAISLCILVDHARELFNFRSQQQLDNKTLFTIFQRLLRHAREVKPSLISHIVSLLVQHLQPAQSNTRGDLAQPTQRLTYMLNTALRLVSLPTAARPFRDLAYQEDAMVTILRYMAEHFPALQISREGYRAVIAIQLAQGKTSREQQWAELKALSWPPWKEDRTAMDAEIQAETHGISRAGDTIRRMQEAGYGMGNWEKAAMLYAGWEVDNTPTIQTRKQLVTAGKTASKPTVQRRVQLGTAGGRFAAGSAVWVARIKSTRTAQEAWACYLVYEDAKLPPYQDVFLAIFEVLHFEERRRTLGQGDLRPEPHDGRERPRIYPGDSKEVSPLPPSTHLYTYTRTAPPNVEVLAAQLQQRGVVFEGYCLAFLVGKASSLSTGIGYLKRAIGRYPKLHHMLYLTETSTLADVPMPIFTAYIELLCRFSNIPTSIALPRIRSIGGASQPVSPALDGTPLNLYHPIVLAICLLQHREPNHPQAWQPVLDALGREASLPTLGFALSPEKSWRQPIGDDITEDMMAEGAVVAYHMLRHVVGMMRHLHVDVEEMALLRSCRPVENVGFHCWKLLLADRAARLGETSVACDGDVVARIVGVEHDEIVADLVEVFDRVTGGRSDGAEATTIQHDVEPTVSGAGGVAPLLHHTPNPATLHVYVRALGWLAAHEQLVQLVRSLAARQQGLAEERGKHRNGGVLMRRVVIALRVFLERSWLNGSPPEPVVDKGASSAHGQHSGEAKSNAKLWRFVRAASPDVVEEVRRLVESVDAWGGWPSDEEALKYCEDIKFEQIRKYYS